MSRVESFFGGIKVYPRDGNSAPGLDLKSEMATLWVT